jgi:TonB family protein
VHHRILSCCLSAAWLLALLSAPQAFAQTSALQKKPAAGSSKSGFPVIQTEKKLPNKIFLAGDNYYPNAFSSIGIQGETKLQLEFSEAGKIIGSRILSSSKSPALDEKALSYIKGADWKLPENFALYAPRIYTLNIIFLKDSAETIDKKTCADFNIDMRYFRSVYPNAQVNNVGALSVISNLFTVNLMKNQSSEKTMSYVRARNNIGEQVVKACAANPKALLLKTYLNIAEKNGVTF